MMPEGVDGCGQWKKTVQLKHRVDGCSRSREHTRKGEWTTARIHDGSGETTAGE
jgi:hypothetical protein